MSFLPVRAGGGLAFICRSRAFEVTLYLAAQALAIAPQFNLSYEPIGDVYRPSLTGKFQ
jgi:hypothetical protein